MKTLSELDLDRKSAEKFIRQNICGICGNGLNVAWGGSFGVKEYIVRCGSYIEHSNFISRKTNKQIVEDNPELRHAFALNVWGNESEKEI